MACRLTSWLTSGLARRLTSGLTSGLPRRLTSWLTSGLARRLTSGLPRRLTSGLPRRLTSWLTSGLPRRLTSWLTRGCFGGLTYGKRDEGSSIQNNLHHAPSTRIIMKIARRIGSIIMFSMKTGQGDGWMARTEVGKGALRQQLTALLLRYWTM